MADILHSFTIDAPPARVFDVLATPAGLNNWWPIQSSGQPALGERYDFDFGPGCQWAATVVGCRPGELLEWQMTTADADWEGTRIRFDLTAEGSGTRIEFAHLGWREPGPHFRISSFCWAAYLRLLRRFIEDGDVVPYEGRDSA